MSSPRAYFGRASRAATRALRNGITETSPPSGGVGARRPLVYHAGDPALRLFAGLTLPFPPMTPLTGAIASLSGVRDGEHEKLFIDLGTSLVRATPRRDDRAGTLVLILSRIQSSETYRSLLASLRYVNDSPAPANGVRRILLQIVDAAGRTHDVAETELGVGEAPPAHGDLEVADDRIVLGETVTFNTDGQFTLYWWPNILPSAAERNRRAARPVDADATGSFFTAGGRVYRLFEPPEAPRVPAAPPTVANDRAPEAAPRAANDAVWTPGRGVPPPGFERARMLRLEDVFGSDMQDAIARRLIEFRLAAGG